MDVRDVTLIEVLDGREMRVQRRSAMLRKNHVPVISFTMNIAGPVKRDPLIQRSFYEGLYMLQSRLAERILEKKVFLGVAGCEALLSVDMDAKELKAICVSIEEGFQMGRLFDLDVMSEDGIALSRESVGASERSCIVCGAPGRDCASGRVHTIEELQLVTGSIMRNYFMQRDRAWIGAAAQEALLHEVCFTPKPGLVDRNNNGSHQDMTIFSFMSSAAFLGDYFSACVQTGIDYAEAGSEECFSKLRFSGIDAERIMYEASGGCNTHKGAIFSLGLLCGAAGRLWKPDSSINEKELFTEAAELACHAGEAELKTHIADSAGLRLYKSLGVGGVRMEAAAGFPHVHELALKMYRTYRSEGLDINRAGCLTLLHLITETDDTNMLTRGGIEGAARAKAYAASLLDKDDLPTEDDIKRMDIFFTENNWSPGGCADLLAATVFADNLLEHFSKIGYLSHKDNEF